MMSNNPHSDPLYIEPLDFGQISLRPLDLLEHVLATGGTGSGKTRSFLLPLVERVLARFGTEPSARAGMLLIDAKGDMSTLAAECAARAGRSRELYVLGREGNCWFPLFAQFGGDPTLITNFLYEALEDRAGQRGNDSFWEENTRRLLRAAAVCAKARHGIEFGGFEGISEAINAVADCHPGVNNLGEETDVLTSLVGHLREAWSEGRIPEIEMDDTIQYLIRDAIKTVASTWGIIANMARNYVAQFSMPALRELFGESPGRRRIGPEEIIDEGLLLVVSLSPVFYGDAATPFRVSVKKAFFDRILQRNHLFTDEDGVKRPINRDRPILVVMDEFHTTLTAKGRGSDAYFLDRAREFRCMCILATQGISAIRSVIGDYYLGDHLLNNCRTKFFFANDCPQTIAYFEYIGGNEERLLANIQYQPVPSPPRFRLPNYVFAEPGRFAIASRTYAEGKRERFRGSELGSLPNGSALVVVKGRKLLRFSFDPAGYAESSKTV